MKKVLLFAIVALVISSVAYAIPNLNDKTSLQTSDIGTRILNPASALIEQSCSMDVSDIKNNPSKYNAPTVLPKDYDVKGAALTDDDFVAFYAPGTICGRDAQYKSTNDGIIQYYTSNKKVHSEEITNPVGYFNSYKTNSDYPDRITVTEIHGNPAMIWDNGFEKNIIIDSEDNVIYEEPAPYPAQITIVDKANERIYMVKGNTTLNNLKQMITSALPAESNH